MKRYERESFIKSLLIFWVTLEALMVVIALLYYHDRKESVEEQLFLEMKNYSFFLEGENFDLTIVPTGGETYRLVHDASGYYALFPIPANETHLLKIMAPDATVEELVGAERRRLVGFFVAASFAALVFALFYAWYTLRPLRQALHLLEESLRDMIHDLNTPVTAILLNVRMLKARFEPVRLDRIERSAKTLGTLYHNVQSYLGGLSGTVQSFALETLCRERVEYFQGLYPRLNFQVRFEATIVQAYPEAVVRIVDNILGNACKYNRPDGKVRVELTGKSLQICDTGYGIRDTKKIFERFYKEGERGMGIGLHIVKKLCDEQQIAIAVSSSPEGSCFTLTFS